MDCPNGCLSGMSHRETETWSMFEHICSTCGYRVSGAVTDGSCRSCSNDYRANPGPNAVIAGLMDTGR
jgi:hypothetical protein